MTLAMPGAFTGKGRRPSVVVIGGGTGAAAVVHRILCELPQRLPACVLVAMHLPAGLSDTLAVRMNARSELPVQLAHAGSVVAPGTVWIGPDDAAMRLVARGRLPVLALAPQAAAVQQSPIDVLFRSAASRLGERAMGVVLSGSCNDGVDGAMALHASGADVLVQDPWSATAWGLPGAIVRHGAAADIVTPDLLAAEIVRRVGGLPTGEWAAA